MTSFLRLFAVHACRSAKNLISEAYNSADLMGAYYACLWLIPKGNGKTLIPAKALEIS
jgi:hypothetical protein